MNRRAFITTSAMGAGAAFLPPRSLFAQSYGVPSDLLTAASSAHAMTTANTWSGINAASNWQNIAATHNNIRIAIEQGGYAVDAQVQQAASYLSPSFGSYLAQTFDFTQLVAQVQAYRSSFGAGDWGAMISRVPTDPSSIASALSLLQQKGLSFYANQMVGHAVWVANAINAQNNGGGSMQTAVYYPGRRPRLQRAAWGMATPLKQASKEGGGGCKTSNAVDFFAGTAFLTLAVMTMGAAPVLVGAAWGGIALYGGFAAGGLAIANAIGCGF